MKTNIYYFSATGNSLVVARDLAAGLKDADIIPITKSLNPEYYDQADVVGIVFPVYMFGLPLIVADFVNTLKIKDSVYIFAVATLGGLPGRSLTMIKDILRKRGLGLSVGFSVLMPGNYTPLYGAIGKEQQAKMFEKEKTRVAEIVRYVSQRKQVIIEGKPFLINFLLYKLFYRIGSKTIPASDKGLWCNQGCVKCGLCEKVCPVANIRLDDGRPVWLHHCQHCMACLQWCPHEAIQYGKKTIGRKRYHHPDINASDIAVQKQCFKKSFDKLNPN